MGRACGKHKGEKKFMQNFGQKAKGKRPFGSPAYRWDLGTWAQLQHSQIKTIVLTIANLDTNETMIHMGSFKKL